MVSAAGQQAAGHGEPGISVVVPVRERVTELRRLLDSLRVAIGHCAEPVEIIVVDDSAVSAADEHRRNCGRYGARYVRGPRHVGAKRNAGVALARYDLVLFIDSDCRATPKLLRRHAAALRAAPPRVAATAGPTEVEASDGVVFRLMRRSDLLNGDLERPRDRARLPWATTSNLMVRTAAFRAVGGFVEESLTVVGGEDVDLGLKLTARGFEIRCVADATVVHDRGSSDSLRAACRRLYTYGRSEQWLVTVHPGHRRARLNPVSTLAAAAVLAAATARRSRGRSWAVLPIAAAVLLGRDARRRYAPPHLAGVDGGGRSVRAALEATACAAVDWAFDLGATVAAGQLRRPDLLFAGFAAPTDGAGTDEVPTDGAPGTDRAPGSTDGGGITK